MEMAEVGVLQIPELDIDLEDCDIKKNLQEKSALAGILRWKINRSSRIIEGEKKRESAREWKYFLKLNLFEDTIIISLYKNKAVSCYAEIW